jgi:hypothetical protein
MLKGIHVLGIGGLNIFIKCIVAYNEKWLHAPEIGGLNNFINCTVGYIEVEVASCPRNRRVK